MRGALQLSSPQQGRPPEKQVSWDEWELSKKSDKPFFYLIRFRKMLNASIPQPEDSLWSLWKVCNHWQKFFLAQNVNLSFILFCTVLNQEEGPLIHYSKLPDSKGPIIPQVLGSRPRWRQWWIHHCIQRVSMWHMSRGQWNSSTLKVLSILD